MDQNSVRQQLAALKALSDDLAHGIAALTAAVEAIPPPLYPPGHFYSPLVDPRALAAQAAQVFDPDREILNIDLRPAAQTALLAALAPHAARLTFPDTPTPGFRYYYQNPNFAYGDAIALAALMMEYRPKRFIEIGNGFSSALALDVDAFFLGQTVDFTFIDPYPDLLLSLVPDGALARYRVIAAPVQQVPLELFQTLEDGDFLFIDSSHISKAGSDVHTEVFEILPRLKPGVFVHFHDIFYPFEYLPEWFFDENRSWNEIYLLRAYLMNNSDYEIIMFNDYLAKKKPDILHRYLPKSVPNPGGSLWLRRR